jgi:enoyl-CoA hydratase/3-hydroxyacyl-CoA dehydrogenase
MSQLKKIGVIGAGNMGSGIVQKAAQEGFQVVMVDLKDTFVERGLSTIKTLLDQAVANGIFTKDQSEQTLSRLHGTTDFQEVADADIVIEAVFEDKQVKTELFLKLDEICDEKTILATNTSSFYVGELAAPTSRPDRVVGLHYFFHPAKNRLLEVIPHEGTSQDTIEKALLFSKLHGKTGILVKDAPGFAVNRFFVPFCNETTRMLEEGMANIPTIEKAAKKAFGIGMGGFELMNVTGIPIAVHASNTLGNEISPFYGTPAVLKAQMEKKENWDLSGEVDESRLDACIKRYYGVCLGVAAALVGEGVASLEDTDRGAKIGLRWNKGPFEIMNAIGIDQAYDAVNEVVEKYPDFKMPELLENQKKLGKPFGFKLVDLEAKDDVAYITINRPEAMNALNETVVSQLDEKFTAAEKDEKIQAIVIQGAGKAFIAGADIKFFIDNIRSDNLDATYAFTRKGHDLLLRLENCAKPTIAYLDGLSLGGGSELALACQKILATPAGSMGFPETAIGIFPGLGGMLRSARHIGVELAKYYVFTGAPIHVQDAVELGLVSKIIAPAELETEVKALMAEKAEEKYRKRDLAEKYRSLAAAFTKENVEKLLAGDKPDAVPEELASKLVKVIHRKAPIALKMADELMDQQENVSIEQAVEIELNRLYDIFATGDALEGLCASVEGRKPEFKGA